MPKGVYDHSRNERGHWGLADHCYQAAEGDYIGALALALDIERISRQARFPLDHKFGGPGTADGSIGQGNALVSQDATAREPASRPLEDELAA